MVGQISALRRYARALVGDPTRADDLVQDCLERAWSRSHLFRRGRDVRTWLFTILHNIYVDGVRQRGRQPAILPLAEDIEHLSVRPAQEDAAEISDLGHALAELPADQAAAVLLVGLEGMSYRDAATVLGVPVGTLMSRLYRGRESLRALVADDRRVRLKRVK